MSLASLRLKPSGLRRLRRAHPWVYRDDLDAPPGDLQAGAAWLLRPDGARHALGLYSPASRIAWRHLATSQDAGEAFELWPFLRGRLESALGLRDTLRGGPGDSLAMERLVHAEADGLPGLVIDRYADVFVFQVGTAAIETLIEPLVDWMRNHAGARAVVERDEAVSRKLEGLAARSGVCAGEVHGPVVAREGTLTFHVDVLAGQKTGAFLDQRENRQAFGASCQDARVLDAYCHDGGFGLHALSRGARHVTFVDKSTSALERVKEHVARSGFDDRATLIHGSGFEVLRGMRDAGETFERVVVDPPAFAKSRAEVDRAERGYRELNVQAMRLVAPGGMLWTCSCSYQVGNARFEEIVRSAAADVGRPVHLVEVRGQAADHPVLITMPESRYLKCLVLRVG